MSAKVGTLFCSIAIGALVASRSRRPRRAQLIARPQLFALVQTKPHGVILASSYDVAELERELKELNETINHHALRSERHAYVIVAVPEPLVVDEVVTISCR